MSTSEALIRAPLSDERKERAAAEAMRRIKSGQHWRDWMAVAEGLGVGRSKCLFAVGTNNVQNPKYKREFKGWMAAQPDRWPLDLDSPTRTHLFWCLDFANEIERWRDTLAQNERAKLNHPTAMKRRYEAAHRDVAVVAAKAKTKTDAEIARDEELDKLKGEIEMRNREIDFLKTKPTTDGGLFDLNLDTALNIAKTIRGNTSLARARGIRDALTRVIKEEEMVLHKSTPKQAG